VFLLAIGLIRFTFIIADLFLVGGKVGLYMVSSILILILLALPATISGVWVYGDAKKLLSQGVKMKPPNWWCNMVLLSWVPGLAMYLTFRKFTWKNQRRF